jgi:hypothetical protein
MSQIQMSNYKVVNMEDWNFDMNGNLLTGFVMPLVRQANAKLPDWSEIRIDPSGDIFAYSYQPRLHRVLGWGMSTGAKGTKVRYLLKVNVEYLSVPWDMFGIIRTDYVYKQRDSGE